MILFLETAGRLASFTHCVTVHLGLNDKNTEQEIRIKEESSWPSEPLENWTGANTPTVSGMEQFRAKVKRRQGIFPSLIRPGIQRTQTT